MDKIIYNEKKVIVIIGAGAAGLLLQNLLSNFYPNYKIFILERNKVNKKNVLNFFSKNAKFSHPNVFSPLFDYLLKTYFKDTRKKIYNLNFFNSLFSTSKKITRNIFFKKIISLIKNRNVKIISQILKIDLIEENYKISKVKYIKYNKPNIINCDYVFDCSATKNFFIKFNMKNNNIKKIEKNKNKILITFHIKFLNKNCEKKIDDLINNRDITINFDFYDLTIMSQTNFYTFTFVSNIKVFNKKICKQELIYFFNKLKIFNYKEVKSIQWIHKKNIFYTLKNPSVNKNLIPVGDSFFLVDPSLGLGITSIIFQVVYLVKRINRLNFNKYLSFSYELFLHISSENKNFSKNKSLIRKIITKYKNYFPFYQYFRSMIVNNQDQKSYIKFLKKL